MDGFKAYKRFMAIKLHFTSNYDVFENNGRVSGTRATFEKRKDKFLFEKLARKFPSEQEYIQFIVANIAYGNKNVVYSVESDEYYQLWLRRKESRTQFFKNDLNKILNKFESEKISSSELLSVDSGMPKLLELYLGNQITLETMVILNSFENYIPDWDSKIMLWHDQFLIIEKAKRFIKFNKDKITAIYEDFKVVLSEIQNG